MEPAYEKEVGKNHWWKHKVIKIYYDEDPCDPRDWDNFGTIVAWHRQYTFDEDGSKVHGTPDDFLEWAGEAQCVMLPVYLLDHSGLWISTSPQQFRAVDSAGWDWGQLGWIYVTQRDAIYQLGIDEDEAWNEEHERQALEILHEEIKTLNHYYTGDVLGYVIEDGSGKHIDSCWGYYGFEPEKLAKEILAEYGYHE